MPTLPEASGYVNDKFHDETSVQPVNLSYQ
jgi:hypothetical protein